jgi:hypothetical protein
MTELSLSINASADDTSELQNLYSELVESDELQVVEKRLVRGQAGADELGGEDIVRLLLDPDLLSALATCVSAWISTRKTTLRLLVRGTSKSVELEVDSAKVITTDEVRRALEIAGNAVNETSN